jgi:hypothetical protein
MQSTMQSKLLTNAVVGRRNRRKANPANRRGQVETLATVNRGMMHTTYSRVFTIESTVFVSNTDKISLYSATLSDFLAGDLGNYTGIFDQYRISELSLHLKPCFNVPVSTTGGVIQVLPYYTWVDFDGGAPPGTVGSVRLFSTVRALRGDEPSTRTIEPRFLLYGTTSTTPIKTDVGWVDIVSTNIPHSGIGYCLQKQNFTPTPVIDYFRVVYRAIIQFRGGR